MRNLIRRLLTALGVALYHVGLRRPIIALRRRVPQVLLYHSCEPSPNPLLDAIDLSISPKLFAEHLDFLQTYYRIVDMQVLESGQVPDRALALTVDDGYRSVLTNMLPALSERDLPARVYVVTDVLNNAGMIWGDELAWLLRIHAAETRERTTTALKMPHNASVRAIIDYTRDTCTMDEIQKLLTALRTLAGTDPACVARDSELYLTDADLETLGTSGISIGNHTASHANLTKLSEEACEKEIEAASARLANVSTSVPSLAYPYGICSDAVRKTALRLGFKSLLEVGGSNVALDPLRIARVSVAGCSVAELFAQIAVVTPITAALARLRDRLRTVLFIERFFLRARPSN